MPSTKVSTPTIISIDSRYNGPINCGNGGYISGLLASFIEGDAEIRINAAFPIETPLHLKSLDTGIGVYRDDIVSANTVLLGSARPISLTLEIPSPPSLARAKRAGERFHFIHLSDPKGCYVCSPIRSQEEGLHVYCGGLNPTQEKEKENIIVAGVWRPRENLSNAEGKVDAIYVWSALDCPGAYAIKAAEPESNIQLLGTCSGSIKAALNPEEDYIVSSWQAAPQQGRKRFMGVAIHDQNRHLMACAHQIWIDIGPKLPNT